MTKNKVLVLGGTGAMGTYLVPELLENNFLVDVTTRHQRKTNNKNLQYIQGSGHDINFIKKILHENKYDAIIDFMHYNTEMFRERYDLLLKNCKHYLFLSSYRVFAESDLITEESPRLLDVSNDEEYLKTDDYALAKARQEDLLTGAKSKNWTIIRPAITYSRERFQLGTMEADTLVFRAMQNLPVVLPGEMLNKTTTMTWAGDVARLMSKLVLNKKAYSEAFNIATSEHHTWQEVANIYSQIINVKLKSTSLKEYVNAMGGGYIYFQVKYDRIFNRRLDNSKILRISGEKQNTFISLEKGLKKELSKFILNPSFINIDYARQARLDKITRSKINLSNLSREEKEVYLKTRYPLTTKARRKLRPRTRARAIKTKLRIRTRLKGLLKQLRRQYERQKYNRADGVILTLSGYYNYGNIIQRYALQEFLRKNGYKFISYWVDPTHIPGTRDDRFYNTAMFVDQHIWRKPFETEDNFPAYIVGSDQVWRNWCLGEETKELGYYFFNFVKNPKAKRIAYAASIGKTKLEDAMVSREFIEYINPFVEKFDAISMREESGVKIIRKTWNKKAQHVLDPTMLLKAGDYDKLIRQSPHKLHATKPIFTYVLEVNKNKNKIINKIARTNKAEVEELNLWEPEVLPPIEQWLKGFRDAEIVVTDSFHGAVFSIINNTPVVIIENNDGGVARMTSLLKQFGLEDRLVPESSADSFDFEKLKPINWNKVNKRLEELRKKSGNWLLDALKKNPGEQ